MCRPSGAHPQEYSTPTAFAFPHTAAVPDAVGTHASTDPDPVALSRNLGGTWRPVTSRRFADQVARLARGTIDAGVPAGDGVGILSRTRYEWTLADYAIWWRSKEFATEVEKIYAS